MRKRPHRIVRNSFLVFIAKIVEILSGVGTMAIAARYLGIQEFGSFAFIRAVEMMLSPVITFGTMQILIREISVDKNRTGSLVAQGFTVNTLTGVVAFAAAAGVAGFYQLTAAAMLALFLAVASQFFARLTGSINAAYVAHERMNYHLIVSFVVNVLTIVFMLGAVWFRWGLVGLCAAMTMANLIGFGTALAILAARFAWPRWRANWLLLRYLFRESFPAAISTFLTMGYPNVGVFFLKAMQSNEQVSLFQIPQRFTSIIALYPISFLFSIIPMISRLAAEQEHHRDLHKAYQLMIKYLLLAVLPACAASMFFSDPMVRIVFGSEFSAAAASFNVLIWSVPLLVVNTLLAVLLTSLKRQGLLMVANGACFVTNCLLSYLLIGRWGQIGASWSILLSSTVLLLFTLFLVAKYFQPIRVSAIGRGPLLAIGAMMTVVALWPSSRLPFWAVRPP